VYVPGTVKEIERAYVPFTGSTPTRWKIVIVRSSLWNYASRKAITTPSAPIIVKTGSAQCYKVGPS